RYLFFVATRSPADEDEWWSCHLDCVPEAVDETPGLRWHCRHSYVLAAPSLLPSGGGASWIRPPRTRPGTPAPPSPSGTPELPDPIAVLAVLADACEEFASGPPFRPRDDLDVAALSERSDRPATSRPP